MTFKQLIENHSWQEISPVLLTLYPKEEKNLRGYETVFKKLETMIPKRMGMTIEITIEKDDFDGEEYVNVSGRVNNPVKDEDKYSQGIEFVAWHKWLGMDISAKTLAEFSELEIIVHCLYEMTFIGFNEEDIQEVIKKIDESKADYLSGEKNFVDESSIEKLFEGLDDKEEGS